MFKLKVLNMQDFALHKFESGEYKERKHLRGGFCKTINIYNSTGKDILVLDRAGLPILVDTMSRNDTGITIEVTYSVGHGVYLDPHNSFMASGADDPESELIKQMLAEYKNGMADKAKVHSKSFYYKIEPDAFKKLGKSLYVVELDIMITTDVSPNHPLHPYSAEHHREEKILDETKRNVPCFNKSYFIVSNNREIGPRYINIHGEVYKIPSIVNHSLKDGFYIAGSSPVTSEISVDDDSECIDVDKAHVRLRLYTTYSDALREGDLADKYALELAETNNKLEKMKRKAREAELKHKKEQLKMQEILDKKLHKYKIDELERKRIEEERSDWYDARTVHRKDFFENKSLIRKDVIEDITLDRKDFFESKSALRKDIAEDNSLSRKSDYELGHYSRKSNYESTSAGLKAGASIGAALPMIAGGVIAAVGLLIKFFFK